MSKLLCLLLLLSIFIFTYCKNNTLNPDFNTDIALYSGKGTWDKSVTASTKMFEWMDQSVKLVNAEYINNNSLDNFRIICFPGGDMYQYSQDISIEGKEKIRAFISNGGGYIGICGGAYFSAEKIIWQGNQLPMTSLNLFAGSAEGPIDGIVPYPQYGMCQVNIVDTTHVITRSMHTPQWILYYLGPVLKPSSADITILGKYNTVNQPAILAFEYGKGRVFVIGIHPEIEEDSDRDGVVFTDTVRNGITYLGEDKLNDCGSDWDLMNNVVSWCKRDF